jgi:hypothetical protein
MGKEKKGLISISPFLFWIYTYIFGSFHGRDDQILKSNQKDG